MQVAVELWIALKVRSSEIMQKRGSLQRLKEKEQGKNGQTSEIIPADLSLLGSNHKAHYEAE